MQADLEKHLGELMRLHRIPIKHEYMQEFTVGYYFKESAVREIVHALLAGKVLCEKEPVAVVFRPGLTGHDVAVSLYAPASPLRNAPLQGNADIGKPEPDYKALYNELVYQVATVVPGESRYQTALRYIREREDRCNAQEVGGSACKGNEGGE